MEFSLVHSTEKENLVQFTPRTVRVYETVSQKVMRYSVPVLPFLCAVDEVL